MSAGLMIGLLLGAILQYSQYCTMGALSDLFLFNSWRRLRVWISAAAIALLGTQYVALQGHIDLFETRYLTSEMRPIALVSGGVLFGWGMVLAGGCVSRSIVRTAQGSLKGLLVFLTVILASAVAASGPLSFFPGLLGLGFAIDFLPVSLPTAPMIVLAIVLTAWCAVLQAKHRQWVEGATGWAIGLLAAISWPLSIYVEGQMAPFPEAINLVIGSSDWLLWMTIDKTPNFGAALILGTAAGAFVLAVLTSSFRIENFHDTDDTLRLLCGAAMMGVGGVTALGDTLGQGVSGLASLSVGATIGTAGMVVGTRIGLLQLEAGGLVRMLKRDPPATATLKD